MSWKMTHSFFRGYLSRRFFNQVKNWYFWLDIVRMLLVVRMRSYDLLYTTRRIWAESWGRGATGCRAFWWRGSYRFICVSCISRICNKWFLLICNKRRERKWRDLRKVYYKRVKKRVNKSIIDRKICNKWFLLICNKWHGRLFMSRLGLVDGLVTWRKDVENLQQIDFLDLKFITNGHLSDLPFVTDFSHLLQILSRLLHIFLICYRF